MATRRPYRLQRQLVFLGGEGASEQGYGRWIKRVADVEKLRVAITAEGLTGGDPLTVVQSAITKLKRLRRSGRNFEVRALLLDRDRVGETPDRDDRALRLANNAGLLLIWQDPCHEAFLVRHFPGYETHRPPDALSATRLLKKMWPQYEKGMDATGYEPFLTLDHLFRARAVEPNLDVFLTQLGW